MCSFDIPASNIVLILRMNRSALSSLTWMPKAALCVARASASQACVVLRQF